MTGTHANAEHADALTQRVLARCDELGFALAGVATLQRSAWDAQLLSWLAAGKHASMDYLARNTDLRLEPSRLLEGAARCVMVADVYHTRADRDADTPAEDEADAQPHGTIARYARGDDYHEVMKRRLHTLADELRAAHPGHECRAFVDTAPVLERELAQRAGLGWIGKHTLLIHPRVGSFLLLGGVMTTLPLVATAEPEPDHCGTCTRCIDACPTDAITPHSVDASRCISYLTIEHRGPIDASLVGKLSGWIYGCDICQEVCPHNSPRPAGVDVGTRHAAYTPRHASLPLLEVLGWSEDDRRRIFKGSAMKRATLAMMKRNAVLLAADVLCATPNPPHTTSRQQLLDALRQVAVNETEDTLVRDAARETLQRVE
ncbi:MAG: tRNA epoxyqueuosine(34) reductase QueG [Planctomycetota bacterium]|nr:tRNA epoxyqueuosine(34) reductase QueG [Planctomycetota bacterium]